jgi:hypothetical protein
LQQDAPSEDPQEPGQTESSTATQAAAEAQQTSSAQNDDTPARKTIWARILASKILVASIAAHLLFGEVATFYGVSKYSEKRKVTFAGGPPTNNASKRALEFKVSMAQKKKTGGAPPQAKRIATTGLSALALPEMPTTSTANTVVPGMTAGMGGAGFGMGMGFGSGMGAGMGGGGGGGGGMTMFGFHGGGPGLVGHFYDMKQSRGKKPNGMTMERFWQVIARFVREGWREEILREYYRAPEAMSAPQIMVPKMSSAEGPKAFNVPHVEGSLWLVHYKGKVSPPKSATYHFVGAGDDVMLVRFNGKLVLDGCYEVRTDAESVGNYHYEFSAMPRGFVKGPAITVQAGQQYDIEVLIGEQIGGNSMGCLLVEEEGVQYAKDGLGNPILPPFRVSNVRTPPLASGQALPPYKKDDPVWKLMSFGGSMLDSLR